MTETAREEAQQMIRASGHVWQSSSDMFMCAIIVEAALARGRAAGIEEAAKVAESHTLGEEIIRIAMTGEVNHVRLWSVVSRTIAAAIRSLTQGETK